MCTEHPSVDCNFHLFSVFSDNTIHQFSNGEVQRTVDRHSSELAVSCRPQRGCWNVLSTTWKAITAAIDQQPTPRRQTRRDPNLVIKLSLDRVLSVGPPTTGRGRRAPTLNMHGRRMRSVAVRAAKSADEGGARARNDCMELLLSHRRLSLS